MKRRDFLTSTVAATVLPVAAQSTAARAADSATRQFLELRRWVLETDAQHQHVTEFLASAALPALGRLGVGPVGVFTEMGDGATRSITTLAAFDSLDQFTGLSDRLSADESFLAAAEKYLQTDKAAPAYQRIESQLLIAFAGFPRVERPLTGPRLFELRVYESHSELKGKLKIEMFNEHEFAIFRKVGLRGVFFGEALVAPNLPNLTYMVAHEDMSAHDQAWKTFANDPDWMRVRAMERYQDTVSNITKRYFKPTDYSQI
jgi:hypothetical protein